MAAVTQTIPVGNRFVVRRTKTINKSKLSFDCISLYSKDLNPMKDLFCIESLQQNMAGKMKINMMLDIPVFKVWKDKIFIEKSFKSFLIKERMNTGFWI